MGLSIVLLTPILSTNFLAIAKAMQSVSKYNQMQARPIVRVRVRRVIVQIRGEQTIIRAIVPIATPFEDTLRLLPPDMGEVSPKPPKRGNKASATHGSSSRQTRQCPKPRRTNQQQSHRSKSHPVGGHAILMQTKPHHRNKW